MSKKPNKMPAIDARVAEAPPRQKLIWGFGAYPLTDAQRKRGVRGLSEKTYELLLNGTATVAWVTDHEEGWEDGYEAGPYYKVAYAFEDESGRTRSGTCGASFDGMHLAYGGGNEWSNFLQEVCAGKITAFTILYNERESSPVACMGL